MRLLKNDHKLELLQPAVPRNALSQQKVIKWKKNDEKKSAATDR